MTEKKELLDEKIKEIEKIFERDNIKKYLVSIAYLEGEENGHSHIGYSGSVADIYQMAMRSNSLLTKSMDKE